MTHFAVSVRIGRIAEQDRADVSADYYQNQPSGFEQSRRGPQGPRERERERPRLSQTGSQQVIRSSNKPIRTSITWGSAIKIGVVVYFALLGVLITLALVGVLLIGFARNAVDDLRYGLGSTTVSSTTVSSTEAGAPMILG